MNEILLTFALTTVIGGILGYFFQNRTWKHQNKAKLCDTERMAATKIFEEVSSLIDKRLFRMRQLNWRLTSSAADESVIEQHMKSYRQVLYEWNDNLNRNLALTQMYFGPKIRYDLENTVYEEFATIGKLLESCYRTRKKTSAGTVPNSVEPELNVLRNHIYRLNVRMIALIQSGYVGIFCKDKGYDPKNPLYHRGYKGPEVQWIQARLEASGYYDGPINGKFDRKTEKAVKGLQSEHGLEPDGKVGPQTQKVLFYKEPSLNKNEVT